MSVYVDDMAAPFGRMIMYHCWADELPELLDMMARIGVDRKWIQGHPTLSFGKHKLASWVHFDISQNKRALAVKYGAIETDRYGPLEHTAMLLVMSTSTLGMQRGHSQLLTIERIRNEKHHQT